MKTNQLQKHIDQFLKYLEIERQSSPLTIRDYKQYLTDFVWFASDYPDFTIEKLDMPMIRAYRSYLSEKTRWGKPIKRSTQNYYVICLRSFLKYLLKNDITVLEPSKIELPKTQSRSPKFLDNSEVKRLLSMPDIETSWGLRDRTILELFFSTGLRVSELVNLNRDSINLERKEFSVTGKGQKSRLIFVSDEAIKWLKRYLATRKDNFIPLFIRYSRDVSPRNHGEKMRFQVRGIEAMVVEYVKRANLTVKATPHTLRHSFATDLLKNGANIREVQEFLGHSSIATTQIYTHISNDDLRNAHRKFHNVRH